MKKIIFSCALLTSSILLVACGSGDKNQTSNQSDSAKIEATSSSVKVSNEPKEAEGDFVKQAAEAYFDGTILKGNTYSIKITDYKVIPVGEAGNEYGESPVIAFWYDTLVSPDYSDDVAISPSMAWIMNFNAIQDNDPNKVNELQMASLPDEKYLQDQSAEIKPGGTLASAVAYALTDETTPVKLIAGDIMGSNFGEFEYKLK